MASPRPRRSLKARALQWLAQREQSRVELRRKLLQLAREESSADTDLACGRPHSKEAETAETTAETTVETVEAVLDWLEANNYLSQERFVESRVNARVARYGNLRIRQELKQHEAELSPETRRLLAQSELDRALAVRLRKFPEFPTNSDERAKQARFLAGRGFSPEVIGKALRNLQRG
jgi:regulatory protein